MAIPDYQSIILPLMKFIADGKEHSLRETILTMSNMGIAYEKKDKTRP
ncbi:MAG: hypothetical protein HKM93_17780 [Desulfobacteraceae bacterium]|nr:hypothetical protein [Desulfobacteraceae bacterium]